MWLRFFSEHGASFISQFVTNEIMFTFSFLSFHNWLSSDWIIVHLFFSTSHFIVFSLIFPGQSTDLYSLDRMSADVFSITTTGFHAL